MEIKLIYLRWRSLFRAYIRLKARHDSKPGLSLFGGKCRWSNFDRSCTILRDHPVPRTRSIYYSGDFYRCINDSLDTSWVGKKSKKGRKKKEEKRGRGKRKERDSALVRFSPPWQFGQPPPALGWNDNNAVVKTAIPTEYRWTFIRLAVSRRIASKRWTENGSLTKHRCKRRFKHRV